jgi:hypothetical protein
LIYEIRPIYSGIDDRPKKEEPVKKEEPTKKEVHDDPMSDDIYVEEEPLRVQLKKPILIRSATGSVC